MYKVDVPFEDFNGNMQTETLYFHLTKTRLSKNLTLGDELDDIQAMLQGEPRQLNPDEIRKIVHLVERIMELSYGIRSEDGKRFDQRPALWEEFQQTAVYDAFLYSLFENPNNATQFILGVMPRDLVEAAKKEMNQLQLPEETTHQVVEVTHEDDKPSETVVVETPPATTGSTYLSDEELLEELRRRGR